MTYLAVSRRVRGRVATTLVLGGALLAIASCGSRTGLFAGDGSGGGPIGPTTDGSTPNPDARVDGQVACTPGRFAFQLAIPQLMFVIDRSGSMAFALDGTQPSPRGRLPPGVA